MDTAWTVSIWIWKEGLRPHRTITNRLLWGNCDKNNEMEMKEEQMPFFGPSLVQGTQQIPTWTSSTLLF
jgi:hypothetical protein